MMAEMSFSFKDGDKTVTIELGVQEDKRQWLLYHKARDLVCVHYTACGGLKGQDLEDVKSILTAYGYVVESYNVQ